ncbi:hypothetical protein KOI35_08605 [Actinoplanes bogorensis]|uniref:Uncharacterized protein n=1 Tax=Paractinoplanes bogorensis TaxID=1610840 RepID=A0ABS5YJB3_9ACTN|nr:hypothetical protein [Actinoplanes bogorensis]MBU2663564.1 hypothetical protein [Actinoplanes bogorensis]
MRPEVAQRLQELTTKPRDAPTIDQLIAAFMAGAEETETRQLARKVLAEHRDFFELNGDR